MKTLKLLNKFFFFISLFFLSFEIIAEEKPVDIWNIDEKKTKEVSENNLSNLSKENIDQSNSGKSIYDMQSKKKTNLIEFEENIIVKKEEIFGLYDPDENGLDINMWRNSDGDQLKNIFSKINNLDLSEDASDIMRSLLLTYSHLPKKNISEDEFLKFKSDWLIKNSNLDLIEEYLIKNQILNLHKDLTRYFVDENLSLGNIEKVCDFFSKNLKPIDDKYLTKFNIYCLIKNDQKDQAQLVFDLKKESGFNDKYFESKINYLLGYTDQIEDTISENSILDFHLAHQINPDFKFEPKESTSKIIWKYLSSLNLLSNFEQTEITDLDKLSLIEKATHNKNYPEKDLLKIYKKFQFDINQLINPEQNYKSLTNVEGRALIYQKILLESDTIEKLKLLKLLKESLKKDKLEQAFDLELKKYLEKMNPAEIPDNLTSFYYTNIKIKNETAKKTKFNKDVLHQSKLMNYFSGDYSISKIEKEIDNFLKKIKKNKKYFFSKKDIIFLESLKSDGIEVSNKYDDLYEVSNNEIPTDIQVMINNNEIGTALLRIVEVIGQDKLDRIDEDTLYFIISTLNQLDIDPLRNKILLKVLPLKV